MTPQAQREKLPKEKRPRFFSRSAERDQGYAPWMGAAWRRGYRVLTHGAHPPHVAGRAHARYTPASCRGTRSLASRSRLFRQPSRRQRNEKPHIVRLILGLVRRTVAADLSAFRALVKYNIPSPWIRLYSDRLHLSSAGIRTVPRKNVHMERPKTVRTVIA